jgi:hypothetical protein
MLATGRSRKNSMARKREQFIDHELGLAALGLNPLDWPRKNIGLRLIVDAVADANGGTAIDWAHLRR